MILLDELNFGSLIILDGILRTRGETEPHAL